MSNASICSMAANHRLTGCFDLITPLSPLDGIHCAIKVPQIGEKNKPDSESRFRWLGARAVGGAALKAKNVGTRGPKLSRRRVLGVEIGGNNQRDQGNDAPKADEANGNKEQPRKRAALFVRGDREAQKTTRCDKTGEYEKEKGGAFQNFELHSALTFVFRQGVATGLRMQKRRSPGVG